MARNSQPPPPWLIVALLGIAGLVIAWTIVQTRRSAANLRALAQRLGFTYLDGKTASVTTSPPASRPRDGVSVQTITTWRSSSPMVIGERDGREIRFFTFTTGSGKSRVNWRAVSVRPRVIGNLLFHFQRQGLATKLKELVGAREIVVGDAPFDAAWFLETNEPDFMRAALVPEVQAKLMAAHAAASAGGNFQLQLAAIRYAEHGSFADATDCTRFEQMLPLLHDLADIAEVSAERGA